ncbi:MAG: hypothetical protein MH204_11240 [Fimbriimonadaceae bacterium]|nr:hypothetical protein [Fimbriimonadaceae bacterium]
MIAGAIAGAVVVGLAVWLGPLVLAVVRGGFLEATPDREFQGSHIQVLKDVHRALLAYADSEGALPRAEGWMDAAWTRLKTSDMKDDQVRRRLQARGIGEDGRYGLAMNESLSEGDPWNPEDETRILVFESQADGWNAVGDPAKDASDRVADPMGVTLAGEVVPLAP